MRRTPWRARLLDRNRPDSQRLRGASGCHRKTQCVLWAGGSGARTSWEHGSAPRAQWQYFVPSGPPTTIACACCSNTCMKVTPAIDVDGYGRDDALAQRNVRRLAPKCDHHLARKRQGAFRERSSSAHRDHFGRQGGLLFAGADDNASGTAVLLEVGASSADYRPHSHERSCWSHSAGRNRDCWDQRSMSTSRSCRCARPRRWSTSTTQQ